MVRREPGEVLNTRFDVPLLVQKGGGDSGFHSNGDVEALVCVTEDHC